ncbi:unnamed protein product, partial [Amoebophrya sp. A120]
PCLCCRLLSSISPEFHTSNLCHFRMTLFSSSRARHFTTIMSRPYAFLVAAMLAASSLSPDDLVGRSRGCGGSVIFNYVSFLRGVTGFKVERDTEHDSASSTQQEQLFTRTAALSDTTSTSRLEDDEMAAAGRPTPGRATRSSVVGSASTMPSSTEGPTLGDLSRRNSGTGAEGAPSSTTSTPGNKRDIYFVPDVGADKNKMLPHVDQRKQEQPPPPPAEDAAPMWEFDYDEEDYENDESHLVASSQQILSRQLADLSGASTAPHQRARRRGGKKTRRAGRKSSRSSTSTRSARPTAPSSTKSAAATTSTSTTTQSVPSSETSAASSAADVVLPPDDHHVVKQSKIEDAGNKMENKTSRASTSRSSTTSSTTTTTMTTVVGGKNETIFFTLPLGRRTPRGGSSAAGGGENSTSRTAARTSTPVREPARASASPPSTTLSSSRLPSSDHLFEGIENASSILNKTSSFDFDAATTPTNSSSSASATWHASTSSSPRGTSSSEEESRAFGPQNVEDLDREQARLGVADDEEVISQATSFAFLGGLGLGGKNPFELVPGFYNPGTPARGDYLNANNEMLSKSLNLPNREKPDELLEETQPFHGRVVEVPVEHLKIYVAKKEDDNLRRAVRYVALPAVSSARDLETDKPNKYWTFFTEDAPGTDDFLSLPFRMPSPTEELNPIKARVMLNWHERKGCMYHETEKPLGRHVWITKPLFFADHERTTGTEGAEEATTATQQGFAQMLHLMPSDPHPESSMQFVRAAYPPYKYPKKGETALPLQQPGGGTSNDKPFIFFPDVSHCPPSDEHARMSSAYPAEVTVPAQHLPLYCVTNPESREEERYTLLPYWDLTKVMAQPSSPGSRRLSDGRTGFMWYKEDEPHSYTFLTRQSPLNVLGAEAPGELSYDRNELLLSHIPRLREIVRECTARVFLPISTAVTEAGPRHFVDVVDPSFSSLDSPYFFHFVYLVKTPKDLERGDFTRLAWKFTGLEKEKDPHKDDRAAMTERKALKEDPEARTNVQGWKMQQKHFLADQLQSPQEQESSLVEIPEKYFLKADESVMKVYEQLRGQCYRTKDQKTKGRATKLLQIAEVKMTVDHALEKRTIKTKLQKHFEKLKRGCAEANRGATKLTALTNPEDVALNDLVERLDIASRGAFLFVDDTEGWASAFDLTEEQLVKILQRMRLEPGCDDEVQVSAPPTSSSREVSSSTATRTVKISEQHLQTCQWVFDHIAWRKPAPVASSSSSSSSRAEQEQLSCDDLSAKLSNALGCMPKSHELEEGSNKPRPGFINLPVKDLTFLRIVGNLATNLLSEITQTAESFQPKMRDFFLEMVPELMAGLLSAQLTLWVDNLDGDRDGMVCPNEISNLLILEEGQKHIIDPLRDAIESIPVPGGFPKYVSGVVQEVWEDAAELMMIYVDYYLSEALNNAASVVFEKTMQWTLGVEFDLPVESHGLCQTALRQSAAENNFALTNKCPIDEFCRGKEHLLSDVLPGEDVDHGSSSHHHQTGGTLVTHGSGSDLGQERPDEELHEGHVDVVLPGGGGQDHHDQGSFLPPRDHHSDSDVAGQLGARTTITRTRSRRGSRASADKLLSRLARGGKLHRRLSTTELEEYQMERREQRHRMKAGTDLQEVVEEAKEQQKRKLREELDARARRGDFSMEFISEPNGESETDSESALSLRAPLRRSFSSPGMLEDQLHDDDLSGRAAREDEGSTALVRAVHKKKQGDGCCDGEESATTTEIVSRSGGNDPQGEEDHDGEGGGGLGTSTPRRLVDGPQLGAIEDARGLHGHHGQEHQPGGTLVTVQDEDPLRSAGAPGDEIATSTSTSGSRITKLNVHGVLWSLHVLYPQYVPSPVASAKKDGHHSSKDQCRAVHNVLTQQDRVWCFPTPASIAKTFNKFSKDMVNQFKKKPKAKAEQKAKATAFLEKDKVTKINKKTSQQVKGSGSDGVDAARGSGDAAEEPDDEGGQEEDEASEDGGLDEMDSTSAGDDEHHGFSSAPSRSRSTISDDMSGSGGEDDDEILDGSQHGEDHENQDNGQHRSTTGEPAAHSGGRGKKKHEHQNYDLDKVLTQWRKNWKREMMIRSVMDIIKEVIQSAEFAEGTLRKSLAQGVEHAFELRGGFQNAIASL